MMQDSLGLESGYTIILITYHITGFISSLPEKLFSDNCAYSVLIWKIKTDEGKTGHGHHQLAAKPACQQGLEAILRDFM